QGTLDFFNARVSASKMDWYKDANRPAEGSFDLEWTGDEFHVRNVRLKTRELTFNGAFIFDAESGLMKRADVPLFVSGRHDLTATARQRPDGVLELTIQARTLNAAPFLETMFEDSPGESFAPNMKMTLLADQVFGMNGVRYTNVSIVAEKRREFWIAANVIGAIDDGGMFQIALDNDQAGRHLTIESDNAGRFGLGVDIFRNAVGGRLMLTADLNIYQTPLYAVGTLAVNDFRMVKSSTLIQALAEDERSGLDEMIREGGVDFKQLLIPFKLEDEVFDISGGSASGPSLGFTMEGQIDQRFERMNINGTVVPAYTLNTIISRIPVIGTILMGGKGEGLFAVNYRVSGTRDDPKVDISEISVLTPGILRKLIGQKKGKLEPEEETTPAEEEPAPAEEPATEEEQPLGEGEREPLPEETPDEGAGEG
ncbi:MAG: AsmA-like C-terminal domain-containing protein, partial [Proteobacteria bacterium]|nr:AsmA-like C-terminal domain-containing protein [Pseudomonadota bacterium]